MKNYTLWLHFKQGEDFALQLEHASTTSNALRSWAESFYSNAEHCRVLADRLEGVDVEVQADTHHIGFEPNDAAAEKVLQELAEEGLVNEEKYEDDEDDQLDLTDPATFNIWDGKSEVSFDQVNLLAVEDNELAIAAAKRHLESCAGLNVIVDILLRGDVDFTDPERYAFWSGHEKPDIDKINVLLVESSEHATALLAPLGCEHERDALVLVAIPSNCDRMEWCDSQIVDEFGVSAVHFPKELGKEGLVARYIDFLTDNRSDDN